MNLTPHKLSNHLSSYDKCDVCCQYSLSSLLTFSCCLLPTRVRDSHETFCGLCAGALIGHSFWQSTGTNYVNHPHTNTNASSHQIKDSSRSTVILLYKCVVNIAQQSARGTPRGMRRERCVPGKEIK